MMDTFTCGSCNLMFHQLDTFVAHKQKHGVTNSTCAGGGNYESHLETVMDSAAPYPRVHPRVPSAPSSACNTSTSVLNTASRNDHSPKFRLMASSSQVPEYSDTPRGMVPSAFGCNSFTSSKLSDISTSEFEVKIPEYVEGSEASFSSTYVETGTSENEDGDIILIEISESVRDGESRARVYKSNVEGLEISHENCVTIEKSLAKGIDEERTTQNKEVAHGCWCIDHASSGEAVACVRSEDKSKYIQTSLSSSIDDWENLAHNKKESAKSYSFPTVGEGSQPAAENNTETESKSTQHPSPSSRRRTHDSMSCTSPPNMTCITLHEPQNTNNCQQLSSSKCDMVNEHVNRNTKQNMTFEEVSQDNGLGSLVNLRNPAQEGKEKPGKAVIKVYPSEGTTTDGGSVSYMKSEAVVRPGNSCTEETFPAHSDGLAHDGSVVQGFGEGALLNTEGMNLIPSECSEVEYTPSPGIYTLILNTDSTFNLVSEGCHTSATHACNRMFVCWPCQKFSPSRAEILSHISGSHPQDLSNINQCMVELSALSPPQGSGTEEPLHHLTGRKVKKKLGRPRKEELAACEKQPELVRKGFKKETEGIVCLDCDRLFPKQRQFDKHRCSVWQDSKYSFDQTLTNLANPLVPIGREAEESPDLETHQKKEAGEEEWQGSVGYKARGRPLGTHKRKRGRPPKVDQLQGDTMVNDAFSTRYVPKEECNGDVMKVRSSKHQPSTSFQPVSNSIDYDGEPPQRIVPSRLQHIPTLPLFSNPQQQERLHKWIAQTDLSFVDDIIDKVYPERKTPEKRDVTAMFTCRECKLLFRTLTSCRRHCAKHMTKKAFTCPDCDFATSNVGGLYSHYRNHTQNLYSCDKCDFRARIKAHYRDHLETHSPCRHVCRLCQKPYSTSSSLRSHIYLNHRNEEGMKFLWWLRRKNQEQDKQNVVFQCPVCHQLFSELSLANQHLGTHGLNAPQNVLKCEVCGLEPLLQGTLKKHLLKHRIVYICCICYEPHVTINCLQSHLKGTCSSSSGEDSLKLSLLYSYTSSRTLPSLFSSKVLGIRLLMQDLHKSQSHHQLPTTKACSNLQHQMKVAGYRQLSQLLQDKTAALIGSSCRTEKGVMKIFISTGYGIDNNKYDDSQASQTYTKDEEALEDLEARGLVGQHFHGPQEHEERVVVISNVEKKSPWL